MSPDVVDLVLTGAKDQMLTGEEHAPLVFVFTGRGPRHYRVQVTDGWNDDHSSRAKALFLLGRAFAQEAHVPPERISAVFLVVEMWTVERGAGAPELQSAVEGQPDRKECLSVLELRREGTMLRQTGYLTEILRQGGTIDLGPTRAMQEVDSTLLPSFFAGVGSAQWSDRQLAERLRRGNVGDL
jgi:hypothetical protein